MPHAAQRQTSMDYTPVTELPGAALSPEQARRFAHRYGWAVAQTTGARVLEVACGAGAGLEYLAQGAARVVGLDYTAAVLAQAQAASRTPLAQADAQRLPFAAGAFDGVVCFEAIYYLADLAAFLAECRRVLVPGGRLLLCTSNPDWPDFVAGRYTTRYWGVPELADALKQAGFAEVALWGALPITQAGARQRWVNRARRWVVASGLVAALGPLAASLQRLVYGRLVALPAQVDAAWIETHRAGVTLAPLDGRAPDRVHRVIYAAAHR